MLSPAETAGSPEPQASLPFGFCRGTAPSKWISRWEAAGYTSALAPLPLTLDAYPAPAGSEAGAELDALLQRGGVALVRTPAAQVPGEHALGELQAVRLYVEATALLVDSTADIAEAAPITNAAQLADTPLLEHPLHLSDWPAPVAWEDPSWRPDTSLALAELVATGLGAALLPLPLARNIADKKKHAVIPVTEQAGLSEYAVWAIWLRAHNSAVIQDLVGVLRGRRSTSGRDASRPAAAGKSRQNGTPGKTPQRATGSTPAKQASKKKSPPPNSRGAQLAAAKNKGRPGSRPPKPAARRKKR